MSYTGSQRERDQIYWPEDGTITAQQFLRLRDGSWQRIALAAQSDSALIALINSLSSAQQSTLMQALAAIPGSDGTYDSPTMGGLRTRARILQLVPGVSV